MMTKRILAILLTVCMMFCCIACTTDTNDPEDTSTSETNPSETNPSETDPSETDPSETDPSDTDPSDTDPSETDTSETENGGSTENVGWKPDTGVFNEGKVTYEKTVVTETISPYPDDKLGQVMYKGQDGVIELMSSDFSDNDGTCGGNAAPREANEYIIEGGKFYSHASLSPNIPEGGWTTWSIITPSSEYKQAQLSLNWSAYTHQPYEGGQNGVMWGCYVGNTFTICDGPGDGLWFSFAPEEDEIVVFHPDVKYWPVGWATIPVTDGLMDGQHTLNIVTSEDYSTYVYITPNGGSEAQLVCSVKFADGKIMAYDGNGNLVEESECTLNSLKGSIFTLFSHGTGCIIDDIALLAASNGETKESTTVTATPTEGNTLGLDITNKKDIVSICYSVWFDAILGTGTEKVTDFNNITEVLEGKREWGGITAFHYWSKPALGYYRSSDKEVIRTHMTQLYNAGVDFIIIDLTNSSDGALGTSGWTNFIQIPMNAICDTIMEMRAEGLGTPYVAFWVGGGTGPLYEALYENYHQVEKWEDCFVYWNDKPLMLTNIMLDDDFYLHDRITFRSMNGLGAKVDEGQWNFLSINNYNFYTNGTDGTPEQISVAVATQETYMSEPTAHGRQGGTFWYLQWYSAFEVRPKIVTLTWWNEWTAQRLETGGYPYSNEIGFVDNYNQEYSRDIEPMEGGHGDQYYQWLIKYVSAYKGGQDCPVLVEDDYLDDIDSYLSKYIKQGRR